MIKRSVGIAAGLTILVIGLVVINWSSTAPEQHDVLIDTEKLRLRNIAANPQQKQPSAAFPTFKSSEQQNLRTDGGRSVIPNALPPGLAELKYELDSINREIADLGLPKSNSETGKEQGDALIAEAETLIASTNQRLGIDSSKVEQQLTRKLPVTDPELIKLNTKIDLLDAELTDWARQRSGVGL